MSSDNGLIGASAYRKPGVPYYLENVTDTVLEEPVLIAPITLRSADKAANAELTVGGLAAGVAGPYTGSIQLNPGASSAGNAEVGVNIKSAANGVSVEIGTNAATDNQLFIAGPAGLSEVYDGTYNQPVKFLPLTINAVSSPLFNRDPANTYEIFRCTQAGIASLNAGGVGNITFTVPKAGFYNLLFEFKMANAATPTIVIPAQTSGGVLVQPAIFGSIEVNLSFPAGSGGVTVVPYGTIELSGGSVYNTNCFEANQGFTSTFTNTYYLIPTQPYTLSIITYNGVSPNGTWNIGENGQLKAELICLTA